jgi:hypothetical protein
MFVVVVDRRALDAESDAEVAEWATQPHPVLDAVGDDRDFTRMSKT